MRNILFALFSVFITLAHSVPTNIRNEDEPNKKYRLGNAFAPKDYRIELTLKNDFATEKVFTGNVAITIIQNVDNADHIRMHKAANITISEILLDEIEIDKNVDYDAAAEIFELPITNGKKDKEYKLHIQYEGILYENDMHGIYLSTFGPEETPETIVTTQFQPTYARRAFPCFDEPLFKATFDLTLDIPTSYVALSNQPGTKIVDRNSNRYTFAQTPKMSTYLVAFVVSNFESKTVDAKIDVTMNVWAQKNLIENAEYAAKISYKIIENLGNMLTTNDEGCNIALDEMGIMHLDQVAIPDFAAGAMENWGLVTYRESSLLWNDKDSTYKDQERVATVIAHEFAHSWFGNWVTLQWWDTAWLNEGFARYFQYHGLKGVTGMDDFELEKQFVVDEIHSVMEADGNSGALALTSEAFTVPEVQAKFGTITYSKGGAIVRMMRNIVGQEAFMSSLHRYICTNKESSVTSKELFDSFTETIDGESLGNIMQSWIEESGYPVINAELDGEFVYVSQKQFDYQEQKSKENETRWFVPISYKIVSTNPIEPTGKPTASTASTQPSQTTVSTLSPPPETSASTGTPGTSQSTETSVSTQPTENTASSETTKTTHASASSSSAETTPSTETTLPTETTLSTETTLTTVSSSSTETTPFSDTTETTHSTETPPFSETTLSEATTDTTLSAETTQSAETTEGSTTEDVTNSRKKRSIENLILLKPNEDRIKLPEPLPDSSTILINHEQAGYYRVNYEPKLWSRIITTLKTNREAIDVVTRAQLIDDAMNLARAGELPYAIALELMEYLKTETEYYPWRAALTSFSYLRKRLVGDALRQQISQTIDTLMKTLFENNRGFEISPDMKPIDVYKKVLALEWQCELESGECVQQAKDLFNAGSSRDASSMNVNVRSIVYCTALRHSASGDDETAEDRTNWNKLWTTYQQTEVANEKLAILTALGCTKNKQLLADYLRSSINDSSIRPQDATAVLKAVLAGHPEGIDLSLKFLSEHFEDIAEKYGSMGALSTVITQVADRITTEAQLSQFQTFVDSNRAELQEAAQVAVNALRTAAVNIAWADTHKQELSEYYRAPSDPSAAGLVSASFLGITLCVLAVRVF